MGLIPIKAPWKRLCIPLPSFFQRRSRLLKGNMLRHIFKTGQELRTVPTHWKSFLSVQVKHIFSLQYFISEAIHEIRSKVILYKEFLKLLYEDDPDRETKMEQNKLQCSEDYEFVAEVHKQTIKLWKMLLYWRKRRHMCYNTSFLSLDMNKIIRSINKINRYFEEKLSKHEFLKEKSRPLYKVVML